MANFFDQFDVETPKAKDLAASANFFDQFDVAESTAPTQYASAVPQLDEQGQLIRQDNVPGPRQPAPGMLDIIAGVPEAALTLGSGAVAGAVAPFYAVGEEILQGRYGEGGDATARRASELAQRFTYQPTTQTGRAITGTVGEALEGAGLEAIPFSQGLTAATLAPRAARQALTGYAREMQLADEAIQSTPLARQAQEARVKQSYARAPQIDAANLAAKYGIALDPAISNPTAATKTAVAAVGESELQQKIAAQNAPVWVREAKKAVGVPETESLNDATFKRLKSAPDLTEPYENIRNTPSFIAEDAILAQLDEARSPRLLNDVDGKAVGKLNKKIDQLKADLAAGVDGKTLLDSIQDYRATANSIYSKAKPNKQLKSGDMQLAKFYEAAAKTLEATIESNFSGEALAAYRAARAKYAQIYSLEAATNKVTSAVDPIKLARQLEGGRPLDGPLGDLAIIASNFPETARIGAKSVPLMPRFARASVGGTLGGLAAGLVSGPAAPVTIPLGIAAGGAISEIGRRVALNRMTRPGYQRSQAVPRDYRPEPLGFVPLQQQNWIYGEGAAPAGAGEAVPRNQLALPSPSYESTINALRAEDARRVRMGAMAEAETEAAAAPRAPTVGGVEFELDPVTGRLTPVSAGAPQAMAPAPTLSTAAEKVSKGQRFAMTPEEIVAWDRTTAEIAELAPGYQKLSQKQIAERMMDRKWVEDALVKARQKDEALKLIEQRSQDMQMLQQARVARERLMDTMESLEDALSGIRPKERARAKGQGPKTRAAKNQLREIETLNNLLD